jgi:hypothetical protein
MTTTVDKALSDFIDIADEVFFENRGDELAEKFLEAYMTLRTAMGREAVAVLRDYVAKNNIDLGGGA